MKTRATEALLVNVVKECGHERTCFERSCLRSRRRGRRGNKRALTFMNAFAFVLFVASIVNLYLAITHGNDARITLAVDRSRARKSAKSISQTQTQTKEEGEHNNNNNNNNNDNNNDKKDERLTLKFYYDERRKQKREKNKERDEEKSRVREQKETMYSKRVNSNKAAYGNQVGDSNDDDDDENGADADANVMTQTIREANVLEKRLSVLGRGKGGKFRYPEEDDIKALEPCNSGRDFQHEREEEGEEEGEEENGTTTKTTKWLPVPERFSRQNVQTRKKEFGKLSKKKDLNQLKLKFHDKASLVLMPSGQVIAFWQSAKTVEGEKGQHVRVATSDDEGVSFGSSFALFYKYGEEDGEDSRDDDEEITAQWTPVPHVDADGNLFLFYAESDGGCEYRDRGKVKYVPGGSIKVIKLMRDQNVVDKKSQWSEPAMVYSIYEENFVPKLLANPVLALEDDDGTLILPFWRDNSVLQSKRELFTSSRKAHCRVKQTGEADTPATRTIRSKTTSAGVLVSKDGGSTWLAKGKIEEVPIEDDEDDENDEGNTTSFNGRTAAENWSIGAKMTTLTAPSVVEGGDKLVMYLRSQSGGVYVAESEEKNVYEKWSEAKKVSDLRREPGAKSFVQSWKDSKMKPTRNVEIIAFNDHRKDEIVISSSSRSNSARNTNSDDSTSSVEGSNKNGDDDNESEKLRRVKLPDKVRTQLTLAISEDAEEDVLDASWTKMKGSVAGVVGSGITPGLMFHNPWVLRVGCKMLVAYSKMYISKFGQGKNKEEAHYSVRVSNVEFTVNGEKVCSSNLRRYSCAGDGDDESLQTFENNEEDGDEESNNDDEGSGFDHQNGSKTRSIGSSSKRGDAMKSLQLTRNINRRAERKRRGAET